MSRPFSVLAMLTICAATTAAQPLPSPLTRLLEGNARYVRGQPSHPNQTPTRRSGVATGQQPFAMILSCADSRVPPEILFDQGLGDLFVVRVAGNIAAAHALGSLEYGAQVLGARFLMVLGHEYCGAVDAAVKGAHPGGHIDGIIDSGTLTIVGARYDLDTGEVALVPGAP